VQEIGHSLLRYESLEGVPASIRQRVLNYLVDKLKLLFPEHLQLLLDDEITSIDLRWIGFRLHDQHLTTIGSLCPSLRSLKFDKAPKLTRAAFQGLANNCHRITQLIIPESTIGDEILAMIVHGCPLLSHVSLKNCEGITALGIVTLGAC
jgi:hypothetical protein